MSVQLITASAHATGLPDKSVHCVVTSPPYYGLRAYAGEQMIEWRTVRYSPMPGLPEITIQGCEPGCQHEWGEQLLQREQSGRSRLKWETGGQPAAKVPDGPVSQGAYCIHCGGWRGGLGNEPTPESFIGHLMLVMREMWRVLRDDGTAWINLGDSYAGNGGSREYGSFDGGVGRGPGVGGQRKTPNGLKSKDLMMIPARFALAAQADGWYLRQDLIWSKTAPMPESVTDRCTKSHEYIFLLAKQERYFFDNEAIKEPCVIGYKGSTFTKGKTAAAREHLAAVGQKERANQDGANGRNKRSVWTINPTPFPGAHFATYPIEIPLTCIKAGCPPDGTVLDPFSGSGTTGRAALQLNRSYIGVDICDEYLTDLSPARLSNVQIEMALGGGL